MIVAHHPFIGRPQPGRVRRQLISCELARLPEGSLVARLVARDVGTAVGGRPRHQHKGRNPAQHQSHSIGRGNRDLHGGVTF